MKLKNYLERYSKDVLDESDEILSVKYQIVYCVGKQINLDGECLRWKLAQDVLKLANFNLEYFKHMYKEFDDAIEYKADNRPAYPYLRLLNDKPYKKLCEFICRDFFHKDKEFEFILNRTPLNLKKQEIKLVKEYILNDEISNESLEFYEGLSDKNLKTIILILRGLLNYDILFLIINKRWKVSQNLHIN